MKKAALFLVLVLMITSIPVSAKAATTPAFRVTRSTVYENGEASGVYKYTVSGLKKGYKVKWGITGAGKKFVTLKYKTTTAKKTTSSNKITVATNGDTAAMNKKICVIAKVYDTSNKLIATLRDKPIIKINAETITMNTGKVGTLEGLAVGTVYDFDATVTPVNATSTVYWTVTGADGADHSAEITSAGAWTPKAAGEYTITATARNSAKGKALCTSSVKVTVGAYIKAITQTGANEIKVVFSSNVKDKLSADNVSIEANTGSSSIIPKTFVYDAVGKTVTVTTFSDFKDGMEYTFTYDGASKVFKASTGEPVSIRILTDTVQADTLTPIEYGLYDANNIDVKSSYDGNITIEADVVNGYLSTDNELYMTTPGKKAIVKLTYLKEDGSKLTTTKTILCVEAKPEEAASTDFTITESAATPDYEADDYEAVRDIALEEEGYAHFRALNEKGEEIVYDSISYSSSNDNVLIIAPNGEITPVKTGTVKVYVTVTKGESELTYTYQVVVKAAKQLSKVSLSSTSVTMSSTYDENYQKIIDLSIYDQYGREMDLSNATVVIEEVNNKNIYAWYDSETEQIIVKQTVEAGTFNYKVIVTVGEKSVTTVFKLTVKQIPVNGAVSYTVEISETTVDTAVDKKTTNDKVITIRLAQYRGGVFESYAPFESATVKKGNEYFNADLTADGSKDEIVLPGSTELKLSAMKLNAGECKKAETGNYSVIIKYYNISSGAARTTGTTIKVTDNQKVPAVTTENIVASNRVYDALSLVKECLNVESGDFVDCTATGETATGSDIKVSAGAKLHIKTVTVREAVKTGSNDVSTVYIYHTIAVGKTLTNK